MSDLGGVWRTISGRRVFIKDGQSLSSAMKDSGKFESAPMSKDSFESFAKTWADGGYGKYAAYSQYLVEGTMKYSREHYENHILTELDEETKNITKQAMDYIDKNGAYKDELYRIEATFRDDIKVGDEVKYGMVSTTRDSSLMDRIISGEDEGLSELSRKEMTMFVYKGEHTAIDISKQSSFNQSESLLKGNYKVTKEEFIKKPTFERYSVEEYMKKFPNDFETFTSKKGREMIRVKANEKMYAVGSSSKLTQYGDGYDQQMEKYNNFVEKRVIYLEKQK